METITNINTIVIQQKLIHAINKITLERNKYIDKCEKRKQPDSKYILKYPKTFVSNDEIITLLQISTELLIFFDNSEITSVDTYIDYFIDIFDIQEECRPAVEYNFHAIFKYILSTGNLSRLVKIISKLSKVDWFSKKDVTKYITQNFSYLTIDKRKELVDMLVIEC